MNENDEVRELAAGDGTVFIFRYVALRFDGAHSTDIFARKNNKSLAETLAHRRYNGLANEAAQFDQFMDIPLGQFLADLKNEGNAFYRRFLNKHGDKRFTTFMIDDPTILAKKGVYAYYVGAELRYIGRCRDTMKQRINQGYGKIHPKNCYIDGQSTNCHLNYRITEARDQVSLWLCSLQSDEEIVSIEAQLVRKYRPEWNIQML